MTMPTRCIKTFDELEAFNFYVTIARSQLSYTDFVFKFLNNDDIGYSLGFIWLRISLYIITTAASLISNVLVIFVIGCNRFWQKSTNYFVLNLVVCDLAIVASCMWVQIVVIVNKDWTLGKLYCKINSYMQMVSILASVFTLVAISWDRFVAVMYPLKAHLSKRSTFLCIILIWVLSAFIALPTFYYRSYSKQHWSDYVQRNCDDMSWPIALVKDEFGCVIKMTRVTKRMYYTAVIILLFFLPMIVLLLTCTIMIYFLFISPANCYYSYFILFINSKHNLSP